ARVLRRKLADCGIVKRAAHDCAALGVRILIDRIAEAGIRRTARAFAIWPAVVGASNAVVDFLPRALPDVVDEHSPRDWLDRERKRIAQAERPDGAIHSGGRVVKRIVARNGAV